MRKEAHSSILSLFPAPSSFTMSERFLSPVNACYGGQQDIGGAGGAMMQSKRTSKSVDAAKKRKEKRKEG